MIKRLKSFEHGYQFITLDNENGTYVVSLYANGQASKEINPAPDNTYKTTTLDNAIDMYQDTCKTAVKFQELKDNSALERIIS